MSKIKYFIEQSWLLVIASFFFGLLLAGTNAAWSPRIEQNERDKLDNLMKELITNAKDFEIVIPEIEVSDEKGRLIKTDIYKAVNADGKGIGFTFTAIGAGFADKIKLVIAVDADCEKFFGFKVLSSNETPGFGSRIKEDHFGSQFKKAPAGKVELVKTGRAEEIDSKIVAITGATVSSEAVVKIFNTYIDKVKKQLQTKGLGDNGH